ncbi:MAG: DUF3300 domain-containing protein, partial [Methylacidiphilales bacterium]|nr:DUF3300 domain-containing protein [Candidatus Methylacidiphilales bacterium]
MSSHNYDARYWTGKRSRVAVAAMFGWVTVIQPALAQTPPAEPVQVPTPQVPTPLPLPAAPATPAEAAPAEKVYSLADLEYLLGPIALYPDPLVALILPATTFPVQIVQADRWLDANRDAVAKGDFSGIDAQSWDTSVKALARFPDVIKLLADSLEWTQALGAAFSLQPADVASAIQVLRARAEKAGNLASTPQQVVTTREDGGSRVIYIAPADPERIYVPVYDSSVVFDTFATGALLFGSAVLVGSAWYGAGGVGTTGTIGAGTTSGSIGRYGGPVVPGGPPPGA